MGGKIISLPRKISFKGIVHFPKLIQQICSKKNKKTNEKLVSEANRKYCMKNIIPTVSFDKAHEYLALIGNNYYQIKEK